MRQALLILLVFSCWVRSAAWGQSAEHGAAWPPSYEQQLLAMNPRTGEAVLLGMNENQATLECWTRLEGSWKQRQGPGAAPPVRRGATLVFDAALEKFVLHGGEAPGGAVLADTWLFDMQSWTPFEGEAPPARRLHGAAYDPLREAVVVYGGRGTDNLRRDDTWEFTAEGWRQIDTPGPPARYQPAMAYDQQSQRIILFAGYSIRGHSRDTWCFDGQSWIQLNPGIGADGTPLADVPPGSMALAAASDPHGGIVVTGGMYSIGDVWRWRDGKWSIAYRAGQAPGPGRRLGATLCFDPFREAFVLGGGAISASTSPDQEVEACRGWWQLDDDHWTRLESR